jgi:hypothetical protein
MRIYIVLWSTIYDTEWGIDSIYTSANDARDYVIEQEEKYPDQRFRVEVHHITETI